MRKVVKITVISLGALVSFLVLATVVLHLLYPPAKLRHLVEEQIRKQLNREAQIGDVSLGLGGLTLERFKLSDVPGFSAGTFLGVEELNVRWAWLPLLSKVVSINTIILEKPQITLIRMADGKTLNISDLMPASPAPSAGSAKKGGNTSKNQAASSPAPSQKTAEGIPTAGGWSWRVNQIHLLHGAIRFDDRSPAHQTSSLSNIELLVKDFDPSRVQGHLSIEQLQNPVYTAKDFSAEWSLHGIDPTLGHLNGWMRLKQGPGLIQNLDNLVNSSPGAKLALLPLVMLQNIDRLGFVKLGLPDFSRLTITTINGDYAFNEGTMKINSFSIVSPQLTIGAVGTVALASGGLAVDVTLDTPQPTLLGEMNLKMHISGTLANPQTNLDSLKKKAFKATVKQLLKDPNALQKNVNDALKNIFH